MSTTEIYYEEVKWKNQDKQRNLTQGNYPSINLIDKWLHFLLKGF